MSKWSWEFIRDLLELNNANSLFSTFSLLLRVYLLISVRWQLSSLSPPLSASLASRAYAREKAKQTRGKSPKWPFPPPLSPQVSLDYLLKLEISHFIQKKKTHLSLLLLSSLSLSFRYISPVSCISFSLSALQRERENQRDLSRRVKLLARKEIDHEQQNHTTTPIYVPRERESLTSSSPFSLSLCLSTSRELEYGIPEMKYS